ncbi:hypothetical protein ACOUN2_03770 [Acinetobacter baumannii]|uniref:Defence against restriction A N-terminal domain-containing protein n=1 Tax=Acinetobacter baumannii TaxID=470 RepID=A0AA44XP10_ACIBA|nr:hypothetical protein [Acinetobacter baumannii]EKT9552436.1 hypothetical protein [Acinetobacter baumannii]EKU0457901.1 hypothetical protein [Acinetobacter baumannii]EKU0906683.1 hypothetical protein [Acinetobacter baumannii]EKU2072118.1 hypothetical protein [Acinetobacter baumannii]EKU2079758.1 hypothetical protein [Acinetobacter baumannii]
MSVKSIFIQTHAPHQSRLVHGFDSMVNSGACSIGFIKGDYRQINALVTEDYTENDFWRVVNLKGKKGGIDAFDSVAVLGAIDDQHAADLAILQFGRMFDACVTDVIETNQFGLKRHLSSQQFNLTGSKPIQRWQLEQLQNVVAAEKPEWDGINLISHEGDTSKLLLDMQRNDDHSQLLSKFDGLPTLLSSLGVEEAHYDSIIVDYQHLEQLSAILHHSMDQFSKTGVKIVNVTESKPFKHKKVLQIALTYDFDDGQNFTILFHKPDRLSKKISPADSLISWKILMNNRDITAAIQPNQGEGISIPVLAGRIMKLINQNSNRFKRLQSKKAEKAKALADAELRLEQKQSQLNSLSVEISNLLNELDQLQNTLLTKQSEENEGIIKENSLDNELPDSISDEEAARLKADLKRLNADPEWAGEDGLRYQAFFERINKALEGDSDAVVWAREWISELDDQALAQQQAELEAKKLIDAENEAKQKRDEEVLAARAAGIAENKMMQAWLDTLEKPEDTNNIDFMAWVSDRRGEFLKNWNGAEGSPEYLTAFYEYSRAWADEHLADRLSNKEPAQNSDNDESKELNAPTEVEDLQPSTTNDEGNQLYRSVIEGQVKVNLELLEQIRDEAEKDLNDPLLIPAVTELLNQVQKMEAENI